MLDLDIFTIDHSKAEEGEWFTYDRNPSIKVKIRSMECKDYNASVERQRAVHARGMRPGSSLPDKVASAITKNAVAEHLVVDWEGLCDKQKNPIPFSSETCLEIIKDERYVDFYAWMLNQAMEIKNFQETERSDAAKNSEPGSDGG